MRARSFAWLLVLSFCVSLSGGLVAQGTQTPAKPYEPQVGQPGKDVVWVPTPQAVVDKMLDLTKVTPQDVVMDLGSGNGITVISAAKRGATAIGIEYNPDMVEHAKENAAKAGVTAKATFVRGDLFETDLSKATVITMFLLPSINMKLRPALLDLKPGTRIASNTFTMEDWEADVTETVSGECTSWCTALHWMVPARVNGTWQMTPSNTLTLSQKLDNGKPDDKTDDCTADDKAANRCFQNFTGTLGTAAITNGKLHGAEINFSVGNRRYTGRVDGNSMKGTIAGGAGGTWSATPAATTTAATAPATTTPAAPARPAAPAPTTGTAAKTYTVQAGDTLSAIAKTHLGNGNSYMKIFELNKDQLSDPNKIKPGQVLQVP